MPQEILALATDDVVEHIASAEMNLDASINGQYQQNLSVRPGFFGWQLRYAPAHLNY
jgi:hypothetical protein